MNKKNFIAWFLLLKTATTWHIIYFTQVNPLAQAQIYLITYVKFTQFEENAFCDVVRKSTWGPLY